MEYGVGGFSTAWTSQSWQLALALAIEGPNFESVTPVYGRVAA